MAPKTPKNIEMRGVRRPEGGRRRAFSEFFAIFKNFLSRKVLNGVQGSATTDVKNPLIFRKGSCILKDTPYALGHTGGLVLCDGAP